MSTPPDPIDPLLDRWTDIPAPSPRLSSDVWRRIAEAEAGTHHAPRGFRAGVEAWFSRPSLAAMFVACCALLGLFLAEVRVNHVQRERSAQLARSYLILIDPLLSTQHTIAHNP